METTCQRCGNKFEDKNYEKFCGNKFNKRLWCDKCVEEISRENGLV